MIFIDLCTSEMHSRPTRAIATLRSRWRGASAAPPSGEPQLACEKSVKRKGPKLQAGALRSDTKANLLSSAPPPVIAEALEPNEETVTSGRQLIARPASIHSKNISVTVCISSLVTRFHVLSVAGGYPVYHYLVYHLLQPRSQGGFTYTRHRS